MPRFGFGLRGETSGHGIGEAGRLTGWLATWVRAHLARLSMRPGFQGGVGLAIPAASSIRESVFQNMLRPNEQYGEMRS